MGGVAAAGTFVDGCMLEVATEGVLPVGADQLALGVDKVIVGVVENSSRTGFIVSSLHKLDLISVVEYCSFSLVTTL